MPCAFAAWGFDRGGAGVAGVVIGAREAGDVAGVAEDLGGEDVADAEDLGQVAARGGDGLRAAAAVLVQRAVDAADVGDQLARDGLALLVDGAGPSKAGEEAGGPGGGGLAGRAAPGQVAQ